MPEYAQPPAQPNDPSNLAFFGCAVPRLRPALSACLVHGGYFDLLVEAPAEAANTPTTSSAAATKMLPRMVFMPSNYRPRQTAASVASTRRQTRRRARITASTPVRAAARGRSSATSISHRWRSSAATAVSTETCTRSEEHTSELQSLRH